MNTGEKVKVLITVKTYPLPSETYQELVCTAGVLEDGSFIRLYPIDFRYRPYWEWYKKYEWIELKVKKNEKDPRPESFRPTLDTEIRTLNKWLSSKNNWAERKKYVLAKGVQTMCWLRAQQQKQRSLGIIRPMDVSDLVVEPTERDWPPKKKRFFEEQKLFGPKQKPLEKIPYKFSYVFKCEETNCNGHKMMIEDWEIGQHYRSMRDKYKSEDIAVERVKDNFLGRICAPNIDTHFFVGTILSHNTWVILGTFWPKKEV